MLRFYDVVGQIGPHSDWRDHRWTIMSDSPANAANQLKKRLDYIHGRYNNPEAPGRHTSRVRVQEMELDDFGVFINVTNSEVFDI